MLSRCFHFGVFEIFVPNLFLLSFLSFQYICVSATYKNSAGFQEKHDGKLCDSMYYILDDGLTQLPVFKRLLVLEDGQLCSMIAMLK